MSKLDKININNKIKVPGSKSDLHRALICASLCEEETLIYNYYESNDIKETIDALTQLGTNFIKINEQTIKVIPNRGNNLNSLIRINESASTWRFLLPLAIYKLESPTFEIGSSLLKRPIDDYDSFLKTNAIKIEKNNNCFKYCGQIKNNHYEFTNLKSSQFITGILFVLPLLKEDSTIIIKGKIPSINYIKMMINTMDHFGVKCDFKENNNTISIKGNQKYIAKDYYVEGDYSSASLFLAYGLIAPSPISVSSLNQSSLHPDKNIIKIISSLGGKIEIKDDSITSYPSKFHGGVIDLDDNPDLGPILMGIAPFATSEITFKGIKRLRYKESDRIKAMVYNLTLLGIKTCLLDEDTLIIYPGKFRRPIKELDAFNDHRIYMSLFLITLNLGIKIKGEESINKSYPTFFIDINQ